MGSLFTCSYNGMKLRIDVGSNMPQFQQLCCIVCALVCVCVVNVLVNVGVCMYTCGYMCMCLHLCVPSLNQSPLFFETGSFAEPNAVWLNIQLQQSCLCLPGPVPCHTPSAGVKSMFPLCLLTNMDAEDVNSGSHACIAGTSMTEHLPNIQWVLFFIP